MLRMLKILCILLKVFMLTRSAIAFSDDLEDHEASNTSSFKIIVVRDYMSSLFDDYMSSSILTFQNYSDIVTVRNEVVHQESTTPFLENIPSEPTFPRAFVEFGNRFFKTDIFVTFRWNEPEITNGVIHKYEIQCWFIENLNQKIQSRVNIIPNMLLQYKVYDLKPDAMYYFRVRAHNEVGANPYTKFINVSTTHENPIPRLLINSLIGVYVLDIDLQISFALNKNDIYEEIVYSALEHKIYGIIKTSELRKWDINTSAIGTQSNFTKITDLDKSVRNLCIDWVAGNLYWIQVSGQTNNIMKLDLTLWQRFGIFKYDIILSGISEIYFLNLLPSKGYLYWMESTSDKQYIIMQSDFDGKNKKPFLKNKSITCFCPYKLESDSFMQIDNTNIDNSLIYWTSKDRLIAADIDGCRCKLILSTGNNQIVFNYLAIDKTNIYLFSRSVSLYSIYILKKKYALLESKENAFKRIQKISTIVPIKQLIAFDKFLQPYPWTRCLTPNMKYYHVEKVNITANSIVVSLPEPIPNDGCERYNLATTIYTISMNYLTCLDNDLIKLEEFNVQTYERQYELQNLTPFTEYTVKLALSNFYVNKLSMGLQFGADVKLTTKGKLNAPEDVTVRILTPTLAAVYWMPPKNLNCVAVNYEVHWLLEVNVLFPNSTREITYYRNEKHIKQLERTADGKFFTTIQSLLPEQKYLIYVRVYPTKFRNFFTDSSHKSIYMYSKPNDLILSGVSTNDINISWIPSVNLAHYTLEYKNNAMPKWQEATDIEVINDKVIYYIENLLPQTLYNFRLILKYPEYIEDFIWPLEDEFTFETLGNVPNASEIPTGTKSNEISAMQYYLPLIVSLVVNFVIYVCCFYYSYRRHKESNERVPPAIMTDIELALLNEVPFENMQPNALYDPRLQYNSDESALIITEKKQITLAKFLGSGAFGKVYQGTVKDFEGSKTTPVAIKMLPEITSSQEKIKLLEGAKLMSYFRHKHVLRLLGTCVDMDSPWLILELMEVDLLKYLRESRTLQPSDSHARLQDLLAMCEDVARGCCYLEEQHFVHRDLACRNCLISGRNRKNRIVKIGDYGLARDIYKDDYYYMKGGSPLPVRWMAPESLNQKFTSQSDVWAFGVLMWEITSLGQTPYYAINDFEVCQYVCAGGKLSKPLNCPSALYQLTLSCWNAVNDRPNFTLCFENILILRDNIEDAILRSVDIIRHAELPSSVQREDVGSTGSRTFETLTANDASNDVIEPLTFP